MSAIQDIMDGRVAVLFWGKTGPEIRVRFKHLAKIIHPDVNSDPRAADAFARMSKYVEEAEKNPDHVPPDATIVMVTREGRQFISYFKHRYAGDLGEEFILNGSLLTKFVVAEDGRIAAQRVESFHKVLTGKLEAYKLLLPIAVTKYDQHVAFSRRPETGSLRRVVDAWGGWDPRHAAWLASCLMDFCCLMDNQNMVHCALTPENVFVDLEKHAIQVIGGWAFTTPCNAKLSRLPTFVHAACSSATLADKKAKGAIDVAAAKKLVLLALGDQYNSAPPAFKAWVTTGVDPDSTPVEEYKKWESVRGTAFGPRKFVKHDRVAADAYKEK